MADLTSLKAVVGGRVQGVFFRGYTQRHAERLGLSGYVRNLPSGKVEVVAEGPRKDVEALLGLISVGPPAARVDNVETDWSAYTGNYRDFSISR